MVDSVVTLHGVQQGSWLALVGKAPYGVIPAHYDAVLKALTSLPGGLAFPDPRRPASQELNPLSEHTKGFCTTRIRSSSATYV